LIGNGTVYNHEGLETAALKHPSHRTFHRTAVPLSDEDSATRFYRWHIDAALYDLLPPKVTTLYAVRVPGGPQQVCRYDDGTHDELPVPLGTTAFVSGRTMFDILPRALQSVAVRARMRYAPHPYVWMSPAAAHSTGLAIESEGKELPLDKLPPWEEDKVCVFPVVRFCCAPLSVSCEDNQSMACQTWKNPVTGALHFQVHPCAAQELLIDALPEGASRDGALYPDGAHLTDLKEVRDLLYKMQRPAVAPSVCPLFSLFIYFLVSSLIAVDSWSTRMTGRKRISCCSITVACSILSSVRLSQTRCAHSISATLRHLAPPWDPRQRT
jgi:hypothetical protein